MPKKRKINNYSAQKQYFFLFLRRTNSSPGPRITDKIRIVSSGVFFSSVAHVLGALLLYEISYETTNARNYAHTFARLDIREDNADVRSVTFSGSDERILEDAKCDVTIVSRSISFFLRIIDTRVATKIMRIVE